VGTLRIIAKSPDDTETLGVILGRLVRSGDLIFLSGELGAGKTHFVRGLAKGMQVQDEVSSPTFGLLNVYEGPLPLYHLDLYRLETADELDVIDLPGLMDGPGVFAIEWGRLLQADYPEHLEIILTYGAGPEERIIEWQPRGERYRSLCEELKRENADFDD
jgi:tRNA threonylcarbamoyladenosine biosynthesis protein TsaE